MKPYAQLTKRGQRRRMRQLVLAALADYDLPVKRVRFMVEHTNTYFRLDTEDGRKFAVRIYSYDSSLAENQAEMFWLQALQRDTSLHVLTPVLRRDGTAISRLQVPYMPGEQRLAIYEWVPGKHMADNWTPVNYEKLGRCMAQLHDHAATLTLPPTIRPKRWTQVFYYPDEPVVYRQPTYSHLFSPEQVDLLDTAVAHLDPYLAGLYDSLGDPMLIHADLHVWNVHVHKAQLYLIDFEDLMLGYPLHDVAITLYYGRSRENYPALRQAFQAGYSQLRPWPVAAAAQLAALFVARTVNFINFVAHTEAESFAREYIERRCEDVVEFLEDA